MSSYGEQLRNKGLQFNGRGPTRAREHHDKANDAKVVESLHDDTGESVGYHTHHADGRVDALVNVKPMSITTQQEPV